jgi:hypothetical protein
LKRGKNKSYNKVVRLIDPVTGERGPLRPAEETNSSTAFLIDGVRYVYEGLGGATGFLRWAQQHETKFRELAMKLLPSQVQIQEKQLDRSVTIRHALPPPGYDPWRGQGTTVEGTVVEVVKTVDVEAVRDALSALSPEEREALFNSLD